MTTVRFFSSFAVAGLVLASACSDGGASPAISQGASPAIPRVAVAPAAGEHLKCFSTAGGSCSTSDNVATLTINNDSTFNPGTTNAGVTIASAASLKGLTVSQVSSLYFVFTGPTDVGGDPRFNIPVTGGDYIFIAANACYSGTSPYTVDAINNSSCAVQLSSGPYYANWSAFVAANPNLVITGAPYILIDEPGQWTIQNVNVQ